MAKEILITGCSSGIGYCAACGLQKRGYRVFATARAKKDVEQLEKEGFEACQLDLVSDHSITEAVQWVLEKTGGTLYALFNNGAYGQPGAVEDLSREALRTQFETNLFGTHELTRQIIPVMRQQGYGRIIQNSSVLGLVAFPYRGAYNASKFALEGLTDTLRMELSDTAIKVVLIEPGPITSNFRKNAFTAFKHFIPVKESAHAEKYKQMETRFQKKGNVAPFTLPPEAVLEKVIKALEEHAPRPRYYVTFPTWLMATVRRLLPWSWQDRIIKKVNN